MANNQQIPEEQPEVQVSGFEKFIRKYQRILGWTVVVILVVIFGYLAINKWYIEPAREDARGQMFTAEQQFEAKNYQQALEGDGNYPGFAEIIAEFGGKCDKSAYMYAGICAYNLERYDEAIAYFEDYSSDDKIMAAKALCCIGDCYAALGNNKEALSYFKRAAGVEDNLFRAAYLQKAGIICEEMGDEQGALKFYEEIKLKYPETAEGFEASKYISRIQNK